jgi:hypothetical protein
MNDPLFTLNTIKKTPPPPPNQKRKGGSYITFYDTTSHSLRENLNLIKLPATIFGLN